MMTIEIDEIIDNPDGSATITMVMDMETLKRFAEKAISQALMDCLKEEFPDK